MFKNKKRRKSFKSNDEYFDWFNKNKIEIIEFKITKDSIKVCYLERTNENE